MDLMALGQLCEAAGTTQDPNRAYAGLQDLLHHGSPAVRKGAVLGLAMLARRGHKTTTILKVLARKLEQETFPLVVDALEDALDRLKHGD